MCKIGQQEISGALCTPLSRHPLAPLRRPIPGSALVEGFLYGLPQGDRDTTPPPAGRLITAPVFFRPPPHLPLPFTASSSHHIFMKLCNGGDCVCVCVFVRDARWRGSGLPARWHRAMAEAAVGNCRGGGGGESAGGCHIRNCLILSLCSVKLFSLCVMHTVPGKGPLRAFPRARGRRYST